MNINSKYKSQQMNSNFDIFRKIKQGNLLRMVLGDAYTMIILFVISQVALNQEPIMKYPLAKQRIKMHVIKLSKNCVQG